ncbi:MAG: AAA family ATPase [Lachnospiraceae bacterium]|nr:AAA family ATPase [Lachnospiraceae bacterium]
MAREIAIGIQDFTKIRENHIFYIDKTEFIREWWNSRDDVTLITRPRRFGKTLNMSMLECFFSNKYEGRADLFEGLDIWEDEEFRKLQGTYPVIFLSFAGVKFTDYRDTRVALNGMIADLYNQYEWMLKEQKFTDADREAFKEVSKKMDDPTAALSLNRLCKWLYRYYGKKCIVLLDEYDTPMQEAYINGYWNELTAYIRALFNNTFKTNPSLERAVMTGITRVSKESIFSDLNNLAVVTTTSDRYATAFGFTETEVFAAMDEQGIPESEKEKVKFWYDGFTFGKVKDIYNPWSVTLYLDERKYDTYWANTSGNGLVGKLIREGNPDIKSDFEELLKGGILEAEIDEQIVYNQLDEDDNAIWSLLLASGYLKVDGIIRPEPEDESLYRLSITNYEVRRMFGKMVKGWFRKDRALSKFVSAMFRGDPEEMDVYMNKVALNTFSYFDVANKPIDSKEPERFYHGFVLGLIVDRSDDYMVKSNRESGLGRYDVVMEPKDTKNVAVIMEFKVLNKKAGEESLEDTAANALKQIEEKKYDADLLQRGIPAENILKYGFAFEGEKCLIRKA